MVGASPLPLRDDGFGQVQPTPPQLRVRRMRTIDVLPPPEDGRFEAVQRPVTAAFARRTDLAWFPGCPVSLDDLRLLQLSFWGFDDRPHTGQLVVNSTVADDVESVFRTLYAARFPIEEMRLVTRADLDAAPTGDGNTTAAYACRPVRGSTSWSAHAYGLAIDVNPFMNPYRNGDLVLPELASSVPGPRLAPPRHDLRGRAGGPGLRERRLDLGRELPDRPGPAALLRQRPLRAPSCAPPVGAGT